MSRTRAEWVVYMRNWRKANPEKERLYSDRSNLNRACRAVGLTQEQYKTIIEKQNHCCAICSKPETALSNKGKPLRRLMIDHDHATGEFRGLICSPCNRGLGFYRDDPQHLRVAANYLENHLSHDVPSANYFDGHA